MKKLDKILCSNISKEYVHLISAEEVEPIPDVMMTAIYQPAAVAASNGDHVNGATSKEAEDAASNGAAEDVVADLPCLNEPAFEFEAASKPEAPAAKKPSYRVLEDPFEVASNSKPVAASAPNKTPNYRVLEDPMTQGIYDASTSSEAAATANATPAAALLSNRPMASEVLEGARERFDKFWSKKAAEPNPEP